jgi:hypothetical protein
LRLGWPAAHHRGVASILVPRSRGELLLRLVVSAAALALAATVVAALADRDTRPALGAQWVRGAAMSVVRTNGPIYVDGADAYLVAVGSARAIALLARSPQMGEPVRYCASDGWFEDRAHGSTFDGLGRYVLGPAPHGLDHVAVRLVDGGVWVDPAAVTPGPARGAPHTPPAGPSCVRR